MRLLSVNLPSVDQHRIVALLCGAGLLATGLVACGSSDGSDSGSGGTSDTFVVLAASSLTETFDQLEQKFESEHKGVDVKLVYDSSANLAQSAEQGAPGDVLATADKTTMDDAQAKKGTSGTPQEFATNVVQLAVPSSNPAGITSFAGLQKPSVKYVVCVKSAPCGAAGAALLEQNDITHKPVSEEVDVKAVLAKITGNDADAGLVYRTDVTAAGGAVKGLDVPHATETPNTYWVSATSNVKASGLAKDWIKLMLSTSGQKVLTDAGFGPP